MRNFVTVITSLFGAQLLHQTHGQLHHTKRAFHVRAEEAECLAIQVQAPRRGGEATHS
jgi:hypothetical protein